MAEYAIFYGGFSSFPSDSGVASVKADGNKITVVCPQEEVDLWTSRFSPKGRISAYVKNNKVNLVDFVARNPYEIWTAFTDDEGYDEFKDVYNSVKGVRRTFFVK